MSLSPGPSTGPTGPDRPTHDGPIDDVLVGGREREPGRRTGLALALALAAGVAAVVTGAVHGRSPGPPPAPSSTPTPRPTASPPPVPRSTDLATTVSSGHVRVPGRAVDEQIALVSRQLQGSGVDASYRFLPDAGGVRVQFDRRLPAPSAAAFRAALAGLPGASVDVEDVPGTTADITVPAAAGYTCVPEFFQPQAVLEPADLDLVAGVLGIFGLGFADGAVTISYTGPVLPGADLQAVRGALAHSCGASPDQVLVFRHR